ncbi:MAG: tetratricopeptide repeat protein [Thermoguttaceae bacterium]
MPTDEQAPEGKAGREPLSPTAKKRLEKVFEVGSKKADTAAVSADFDYATELLRQCVSGDPSNALWVKRYLENLQKKYGNNKKGAPLAQFKERGSRGALKKALAQGNFDEAIRQGLKALTVNPWDVSTLVPMATAAAKAGDHDCELCYLKAALIGSPKDHACNRLMAMAMAERGLIDEAIVWWHRVEEISPHDDEAKRSIASLTVQKQRSSGKFEEDDAISKLKKKKAQAQEELSVEERLRRKVAAEPESTAPLLELAQCYMNSDRFVEADKLLTKAHRLAPEDPDIREKWEDVQLRVLRQRILKASDPETKKKLEALHLAKELEVYQGRVARYPNELTFKYELGRRYLKAGQYAEAIRELQTAQNDPRRKGVCLLVLGQCFEQIKQYPLAKAHYESALVELPERDADNRKRTLYLAGRLTLHIRDLDAAEKHLTTLAALDFTYKDVSKLLDKLAKLRDNGTTGSQPEPSDPKAN